MTKNSEQKTDEARSCEAAGYATDEHDQVIRRDGSVVGECWTQTDALALARELNKQSAAQAALIDLASGFAAKLICCGEISINDFRQSLGDALPHNDKMSERGEDGK